MLICGILTPVLSTLSTQVCCRQLPPYRVYTLETYPHQYHYIFKTEFNSNLDAGRFGTGDYGLQKAIGHVDFYPANGNIQPYCQFKNFYKEVKRIKSLPIDEIIRSVFGMQSTCDHRMAKVYFIHSFLHPELYLGKFFL